MSELKPCPFCGGQYTQARYFGLRWPSAFQDGYRGECCDCGAITRAFDTESAAIDAWNTRAYYEAELDALPMTEENMREHGWVRERTCRMEWDEDSEGEELYPVGHVTCSACGAWLYAVNTMRFCPECGAKVTEEDTDGRQRD